MSYVGYFNSTRMLAEDAFSAPTTTPYYCHESACFASGAYLIKSLFSFASGNMSQQYEMRFSLSISYKQACHDYDAEHVASSHCRAIYIGIDNARHVTKCRRRLVN